MTEIENLENVMENVNDHKFLVEELLIPNMNKTDANRGFMVSSHINQAPVLRNAEQPLVYTGFENQIGENCKMGFLKAKEDYEVVAKFQMNKYKYFLVVKNKDNIYDVIERKEAKWLIEKFGYIYNNPIDKYKVGDEIKKDDVLIYNNNYDEELNFKYGVNLNTVYLSYKNLTYEDAVILTPNGKEKLKSDKLKVIDVNINTNDIPLNLYGDEKNYKAFPEVGEKIKGGILLALRRINYKRVYELNNKDLTVVKQTDDKYYAEGTVIDINIWSNRERDNSELYNQQLYKEIDKIAEFHKNVYKTLKPIIEDEKQQITEDLLLFYNTSKKYIDTNSVFTYQGNSFDSFVISFTILDDMNINIGSKITGRYGNKGVQSFTIEDVMNPDEIPTIEDGPFKGQQPDVILNPLGVPNRLIVSVLFELEINFISKHIRYYMSQAKTYKKQIEILLDYMSTISTKDGKYLKNLFKNVSEKEGKELINDMIEKGIPVHQSPFFDNIDIFKLFNLYQKYDIKPFKFKGIKTPLIMGELYFIKLKHEAASKASFRSSGQINLKNLPEKGRKHKESKESYSKTPIRLGEMEICNLILTNEIDAIKELVNSYSVNSKDREILIKKLLVTNVLKDFDIIRSNEESSNVKILKTYFKCLGLEFVENNEENELDIED